MSIHVCKPSPLYANFIKTQAPTYVLVSATFMIMLIQTLIVGCAGIETPTSTTVENEHLIQPEGKFDTGYYPNVDGGT